MNKVTKIYNYPWHISHQASLVKIPDTKWSWLIQHRRQYSTFPRDDFFTEYGMEWVPYYEEGKYDFALLHLDQQCFEEDLWKRGKGSLFREINSVIQDIPKVLIMHGTPFYPEAFTCDIKEGNYKKLGFTKDQIGMSSVLINKFKEVIKDIDVIIFNSKTAQRQWGFATDNQFMLTEVGKTSKGNPQYALTIWHGLNADNWYDLPKEPRVVTMISPAGLDMYYDRTFLRAVKEALSERDIEHCHITVDASFKSWHEYRNFLGRSLVYFNPTRQSPMPRARSEAMLSGCCVVTRGGQDVEDFIEDGKDAVMVPRSPSAVADIIETLILDYKTAIKIGQAGKAKAQEVFSEKRFQEDWKRVINIIKK